MTYQTEFANKILCLGMQIASAMKESHEAGVVHLNLHAGNVYEMTCGYQMKSLGFYITKFGDPCPLHPGIWNKL
jgi:hypothetical protein